MGVPKLFDSSLPKGAVLPVVQLCPAPKRMLQRQALVPGVATLQPKGPTPSRGGWSPNMKGDGVVPPNTEPLVQLLVVWVVAPKPEVVAAPSEKTAVVLPKAGRVLVEVPKAEVSLRLPTPAERRRRELAGLGSALGSQSGLGRFQKVKELPKLGRPAAALALGGPKVGWGWRPGRMGGSGLGARQREC